MRRTFGSDAEPKRASYALARRWERGFEYAPVCAKHAGRTRGSFGNPACEFFFNYISYKLLLILLFTSLLAIPLARQRFLHTALFARLQVKGMTLYFLDDVFLLNLALEPAQRIFKRLAFLHANLCQLTTPPNRPNWVSIDY